MASLKYNANSSLQTVTLGSAYTAGSGSMSLTAGHGARLPASGDFWLAYNDGAGTVRIFKVTSRFLDSISVTPDATEGSGDGNISSGATLRWSLTVSALTQLRADIVAQVASGSTLLSTQTASSSAALTFNSLISSTYDSYEFVLINLVPATDAQPLLMEVSTDNGATWLNTNYQWRQVLFLTSSIGYNSNGSDSSFQIGYAQSNTTLYNSGRLTLRSPASGCNFSCDLMGYYSPTYFGVTGSGSHSTANINAVRFKYASGNIASGTIRVYGLNK